MNRTTALQAIRRFWWVVVAFAAVGAIAGALPAPATTADAGRSYSATYSILLQSDDVNQIYNSTIVNQLRTFTKRGEVPKRATDLLGRPAEESTELAAQVEVSVDTDALEVLITTQQTDPEWAVELVDAFAESLIGFIAERQDTVRSTRLERLLSRLEDLEDEINDLQDDRTRDPDDALISAKIDAASRQYSVVTEQYDSVFNDTSNIVLTPLETGHALENTQSTGLGPPRSRTSRGAWGLLLGLAVGALTAMVISRMDRRIRTRALAEEVFGGQVSVGIPEVDEPPAGIVVHPDRHDRLSDSYRTLRSVIAFSQASLPKPPEGTPARARVTLVVSACAGDGKTSVAANLAAAMGEVGKRVVAVNADFRRPTLTRRLVDPPPDPLPYTLDSLDLAPMRQLLQRSSSAGVVVFDLTSVKAPPGSLARATARGLPSIISMADMVVIDTSPVGITAEVLDLLPLADTVVVVMRLGHTLSGAAQRTMELLHSLSTAKFHLTLVGDATEGSTYYEYGGREPGRLRRRAKRQ